MPHEVLICSKRGGTSPIGYRRIDVTSHARDIFRSCSPFLAGPVNLYGGRIAKNVENGWQYSKVYRQFLDENGDPSPAYFEWAQKGWDDAFPQRYPMGRNMKPQYSYWNGEKLGYIEARKRIYMPLYSQAVVKTPGYQELKRLYNTGEKLCLLDFDAYDFKALGYTAEDIQNDASRKMGHCFVLKFLLEGTIPTPHPFRVIVVGSPGFNDYRVLQQTLDYLLRDKTMNGIEIIPGAASGTNVLSLRYAGERGYEAATIQTGLAASVQDADAFVAFWDGQPGDTQNMIAYAKTQGLAVRVNRYTQA